MLNSFVSPRTPRQAAYAHYLAHSWRWKFIKTARLWWHTLWHGRECLTCPSKERLQIHHREYVDMDITPLSWLNPWSLWMEFCDTRVLCAECHSAGHRGRSIAEFAD